MIKNNLHLEKICTFLSILLPIGLLIGSGVSVTIEILLCIFFLTISFYHKNFDWVKKKYFFLLMLIWVSLLINLVFTKSFNLSFLRNVSFIENIFFVFAFSYVIKKERSFNFIFTFFLTITTIVAFDIYFEYFNKVNILGIKSYDPTRIASFLGKELKIGAFMLGFSFISIAYYFERHSNKSLGYKLFGFFLLLAFFISILLTGERANSVKAIFIIILFIAFSQKKQFRYKKIFFTMILLITFCSYFFSERVKYRFNVILTPINNIGLIDAFKETQHGAHFYTAKEMFVKYPFFGVGNKNFRVECNKEEYENKSYKRTAERCATHPHQIYYELFSELGLIGALIILSVIFFILFESIKIYIKNNNLIHLASILFVSSQFLPIIPSGSFFNAWSAAIFWLNFSILIFYNNNSNKIILNYKNYLIYFFLFKKFFFFRKK
jgi:O-antigen ligase